MRIEPLEVRQLLAVANGAGGLTYTAADLETNNVILSPGAFFSIQDSPDVAQYGLGGCVPSDFLRGMGISVDVSAGTSIGIGAEVEVGVGIGFGMPLFIDTRLPDGVLCPTPSGLTAATGVGSAVQNAFNTMTKGVSSAVAGVPVSQAGNVYYNVSAATGTVTQYALYQAVVDPAAGILETESNDSFARANTISTSTLIQGTLASGSDVDFYKFNAAGGDRVSVILDADPERNGNVTNTKITLYGRDGQELFSNVSFGAVNVAGAVIIPMLPALGPLYLSVESPGYGQDNAYRFVVIKTNSGVDENQAKPMTFSSGNINLPIPDMGSAVSSLAVDVGNVFARANNFDVAVNITQTYDSDLRIYLESPSGTTIQLSDRRGGSGDNYTSTVFTDSAATPIALGLAPFTGSFKPEEALSKVAGELINGTWKLHIEDTAGGDIGKLVNWSMTFRVASNDTPTAADPVAANQYARGAVPSSADTDYFRVGGAGASQLVFAYVDTHDLTRDPNSQNSEDPSAIDSLLKVYANDGTTLLATDNDSGPLFSSQNYDSFNKQLEANGVDLGALSNAIGGVVTIDLRDGNDSCDASKLNLVGQEIRILGGPGNDTILGPGGDHVTLQGDAGDDTFVFNNDSPAVVTIQDSTGANDTLQVNGTAGNDIITVMLSADQQDLLVSVNGIVAVYKNIGAASIENLGIDGRGGDDIITIDCSNGAVVFANSIGVIVEGSASELRFASGSTVVEANSLEIGPIPGSGTSTIAVGGKIQVVEFSAPSPVAITRIADSVLGPLEVRATGAANAISLGQGSSNSTSLLQIDQTAFIELGNKVALTLDADSGNDIVDLRLGAEKGFLAANAPVTVNGEAGDDVAAAQGGLEAYLAITLDGGTGNDVLSACGTLDGGAGDDTLTGGAGLNTLDGDDGNDTLVAGPGTNTISGGNGHDTLVVQGTAQNDAIVVAQTAVGALVHSITTDGVTAGGNDTFSGIEAIRIDSGRGDDTIQVTQADDLPAGASLPIMVVGNEPSASDRLSIVDDGPGDLTILRQALDGHSGSITVGSLAPVTFTECERVDLQPVITAVTDGYGSDGKGRLVVMFADSLEANDSRRVATDVAIAQRAKAAPSIDPVQASVGANGGSLPADEDWYKFTAPKTGTYRFAIDFEAIGTLVNGRPGLPGDGLLKIAVYDNAGTSIGKTASEGDASQTVGVEKGKTYYLRVCGVAPEAVNVYQLDVVDVDIFGPQVTDVRITAQPEFNLFANKQNNGGTLAPTPLVYGLTITVQDNVARWPGFPYPALDEQVDANPGLFRLVGDANGVIPISNVTVHNNLVAVGSVPTATITLGFAQPLPDDRYTLTLSDGLVDPAGNKLDGESNASEPNGAPQPTSGNSVSGGDYVARFTVDSRPELGVWAAGSAYVDTNGNFQFDSRTTDFINRDYTYVLGYTSDQVFAGNFAALQQNADGFDKLATYGKLGSQFRWSIDTDNDGVPNLIQYDPANIIGMPVAADFDGNAQNGDEVALFDGKSWYIDRDHNFMVNSGVGNLKVTNGQKGYPVVGDFDGDGKIDLATYQNGVFSFDFCSNGYGAIDTTMSIGYMGFIGVRTRPVAMDMDQDGITDIGVWAPDRSGASTDGLGEWYWLISDDLVGAKRQPQAALSDPDPVKRKAASVATLKATLNHPFTMLPPNKDLFARFGNQFGVPVVGNFDPPVSESTGQTATAGPVVVNLVGMRGNDRFAFSPGSTPNTWTVTFNGASQTIVGASIEVTFDGQGGSNTVSLSGSEGDDTASLWPNRAVLTGSNYSVSVQNAASITLDARGGVNTVSMFGSSRVDTFSGNSAEVSMSGRGYKNRVRSFTMLNADGLGGKDIAAVHDSVLAGPLDRDAVCTLPDGYVRAAYLTSFETLQRKNKRAQGGNKTIRAADQVFAAYW